MSRQPCFIVLLRWFLSCLWAENVRSEVVDVTGIVKYIRKKMVIFCFFLFRQNVSLGGRGWLRKSVGIIAKASFYLFSSQTLITLYHSLVYLFLTYSNVAWSSTYCSNLNCIYLLQKRLVRLITKAHYPANTAPLFSQLKVPDIFSINSFSVATFMYSYHRNCWPIIAFVTCS